jgi:tRNA pseudouridine55 synthase
VSKHHNPNGSDLSSRGLILVVDKPAGWTSFDVVNKLRRALGWRMVGHAGTLDPAATGVLIVLCGAATARCGEFMDLPKSYAARVRFGVTTNSDDLTGEVLSEQAVDGWNDERIARALMSFVGDIEQVPPVVSAIKLGGKRSYELARSGKPPVLPARKVRVFSAKVVNSGPPDVDILISCSRGTYVRSIARDWGCLLGWGGTLASLARTAVGRFRIEGALSIDEILRRAPEFSPE